MNWVSGPFVMPLGGAVAAAVMTCFYLWPRRHARGAKALIATLATAAWWAGTELVQYGMQDLAGKVLWTNLVYFAIVSTPVLWFVFCLQFTQTRERLHPSEWLALAVIPVSSLVLLWINPTDGMMRRNVSLDLGGPVALMLKDYGPWFWVMVGYSYILMLWGSLLLLQRILHSRRIFSLQALILFGALACPWASNVVWLIGSYDWFDYDPTSLAFGASSMLFALAVHRIQLFDLAPAARDTAIQAMRDGWLVVDAADRLVDLNPAARQMLGGGELVGGHMSLLAPPLSPLLRAEHDFSSIHEPITLGAGDAARQYDVAASELVDRNAIYVGHVLILRDVTRRIAAQGEREKLIQALQEALADVRQLGGLLPICAQCKKIRDDTGYWTRLEEYISQNSEASFTHGFCPECMAELLAESDLESEDVAG